ncbi:MAG: type II toxin-antitoxin system VapC family toxin [Synechococcaceae cyanobacterium]|nr:type II toxin-antitoxin system VapC family toxin [Synechococcaceae cyanobacterium]
MSDTRPLVVDSSGWIEYFTDGPAAPSFAAAIAAVDDLVVPSLSLFEVFRWVLRRHGEGPALQGLALMLRGRVVDLDADLAVQAARLAHEAGLPMADSVILATARAHGATLLTLDSDFTGQRDVHLIVRPDSTPSAP